MLDTLQALLQKLPQATWFVVLVFLLLLAATIGNIAFSRLCSGNNPIPDTTFFKGPKHVAAMIRGYDQIRIGPHSLRVSLARFYTRSDIWYALLYPLLFLPLLSWLLARLPGAAGLSLILLLPLLTGLFDQLENFTVLQLLRSPGFADNSPLLLLLIAASHLKHIGVVCCSLLALTALVCSLGGSHCSVLRH